MENTGLFCTTCDKLNVVDEKQGLLLCECSYSKIETDGVVDPQRHIRSDWGKDWPGTKAIPVNHIAENPDQYMPSEYNDKS